MNRFSNALAARHLSLLIALLLSASVFMPGCGLSDPVRGQSADIPVLDTSGDQGPIILDGGEDARDGGIDSSDDPGDDPPDDPIVDLAADAVEDQTLDLPPDDADTGSLSCDGLCDVNATCVPSGEGEACICNQGFEGDGETCTPVEPPFVIATPESITFGDVGLYATALDYLEITNIGRAPRTIIDVALRSTPSQGFAIVAPVTFPMTLLGGDSVTVGVRFRPTVSVYPGVPTPYSNTVRIESDDPVSPNLDVPISGTGVDPPEHCLSFEPDGIDFGRVEPGSAASESLVLSNCGTTTIDLDALALSGPATVFDFSIADTLPLGMAPAESTTITVEYEPLTVAAVQGVFEAVSDDGAIAVALLEGGVGCPIAAATVGPQSPGGRSDYTWGLEGSTFRFDGSDSDDPADGDLTYAWQFTTPDNSTDLSVDPDLGSETFTMVPDVPGRFVAHLRVTSSESGLESCNVARAIVDAFPLDPEVAIAVTWDNGADLDLHLVEAIDDAPFSEFGSQFQPNPKDAYWANSFANFGVLDDPSDNALYLTDDTDGYGPETIELGRLTANSRYRIGVLYARRNQTESVTATVEITVGDADPVTFSANWSDTLFWVPAIIEGDGAITEVDEFVY